MKYRIYSYFLLIVLVFYILRPVLPYIEYAVNKDYIAKYLCINRFDPLNCCKGKCFLEKQIKKNIESNNSKENNTNNKVQKADVKEYLSALIVIPKLFEANLTHLINPITIIKSMVVFVIFIPPKYKFIL